MICNPIYYSHRKHQTGKLKKCTMWGKKNQHLEEGFASN